MALLRKLFFRKPPDGLLEISDRVYVFDSCFTAVSEEVDYRIYIGGIIAELQDRYSDASFLAINFFGGTQSQFANILSEHDLTVMDYPHQYVGCPLLSMELIHHFLRSSENWLSLGQHNALLMHCERGSWPVLGFMLAALLIYSKQYTGEQKTLEMVYKQAGREHLQLHLAFNPLPSQLRYLQYVSRRNVICEWPPLDRAITLDCIIIRLLPNFDREGGCRPLFRIYGPNPPHVADRTPKILFSTPKGSKFVRLYKQEESELVKIDINCHIQGDIVIECINLHEDMESEELMLRAMFNTAFIRSNILILNRDEIDTLWNGSEKFMKDFRAEVLFSEIDAASPTVTGNSYCFDEEGLPMEAFTKVQEMFHNVDWLDPKADAALNVLQRITAPKISQEQMDIDFHEPAEPFASQQDWGHEKIQDKPTTVEKNSESSPSSIPQDHFVPSTEQNNSHSGTTLPAPMDGSCKAKSKHSSVTEQPEEDVCKGVQSLLIPSQPQIVQPFPGYNPIQGSSHEDSHSLAHNIAPPTPPPPPALLSSQSSPLTAPSCVTVPPPLPPSPPPPPTPPLKKKRAMRVGSPPPPPPPFHSGASFTVPPPALKPMGVGSPPPPPPPPLHSVASSTVPPPAPKPPPPPGPGFPTSPFSLASSNNSAIPSAPPPISSDQGFHKTGSGSPSAGPPCTPLPSAKGRILSRTMNSNNNAKKLKPLHWLKLTRAVQGSLWAETQKYDEVAKAPDIDMSELENLFSAAVPNSRHGKINGESNRQVSFGAKSDKVQLIEHRRAYNCEIMLSKVKTPLHELTGSVLALEDSAFDDDQIDNLIKFCPAKEEMELLMGYSGDKEKLGKCEQFFLELMKLPRVESKLRVFSFKMHFGSQVSALKHSLHCVNAAAVEIQNSTKLKRVMQTILSLGNALNKGTARGSAVGFRLDSLLKLTETRARNNKTTLMHYLCKVLADKLPELLDFSNDLSNLEPASKIQVKVLAEEMQAINKGLENVIQELSISGNDGQVSEKFCKILKEFLQFAEGEARSLASLYSAVGRNVDVLIVYFGEDPSRCQFEHVVSTLLNFVRMFNRSQQENCKQLELEKKKAEKAVERET